MNEITKPDAAPPQSVTVRQDSAPAITEGPGALLNAIVQMARDPSVDVTKLHAILEMQERMEARQAEIEFNRALARLPPIHVKKNGQIDLTSKDDRAAGRKAKAVPFARWEDIARVIEPMLEAEGFRLMFNSSPRPGDGGGLIVTGMLLHRDGHSKTASIPLALDTGPGRNNLQAMGSTFSYGKRYCTEMLLNIVREGDDDDGKLGGTKFVGAEEIAELEGLIERTTTDRGRFLHFFEIAELANLPADDFTRARNMLLAKLPGARKQP